MAAPTIAVTPTPKPVSGLPDLPGKDASEYTWLVVALCHPSLSPEQAPTPRAYAMWMLAKKNGLAFEQRIFDMATKIQEKQAMAEIEEGRTLRIEPCMEAIERLMESLKENAKVS